MKKLSDFEDEKAFAIVGDLLSPVVRILTNEENKKLSGSKTLFDMLKGFMRNSAAEMREIFAILSETPIEEYHCNAVDVAANLVLLATDKALLDLFTSQGKTLNPSGSATPTAGSKA